jgi:hypothetical protein
MILTFRTSNTGKKKPLVPCTCQYTLWKCIWSTSPSSRCSLKTKQYTNSPRRLMPHSSRVSWMLPTSIDSLTVFHPLLSTIPCSRRASRHVLVTSKPITSTQAKPDNVACMASRLLALSVLFRGTLCTAFVDERDEWGGVM